MIGLPIYWEAQYSTWVVHSTDKLGVFWIVVVYTSTCRGQKMPLFFTSGITNMLFRCVSWYVLHGNKTGWPTWEWDWEWDWVTRMRMRLGMRLGDPHENETWKWKWDCKTWEWPWVTWKWDQVTHIGMMTRISDPSITYCQHVLFGEAHYIISFSSLEWG